MYLTFKVLRNKNKLTCEEVAKYLGITESAYRKYERSARLPRAEKLVNLKKIFNCTDEEILQALQYHTARKTKE